MITAYAYMWVHVCTPQNIKHFSDSGPIFAGIRSMADRASSERLAVSYERIQAPVSDISCTQIDFRPGKRISGIV